MTSRTLVLMRHGKSGYPDGVGDHERPLARRGQREAALAGDWLRETQPCVDSVLCSTSTRTRETLERTGIAAPTTYDAAIYGATPDQVIEAIQLVDDAAATLLVVGHAPGMPTTAWELASNRESSVADELSSQFPTSTLAVLTFDGSWAELNTGSAELVAFHIPR
ncbi:SixA phosphatase family protein [Antrihabitans cavernicola]|uniref:Histidine phosphatase family protein n=1 Tax=Antrihabitans cavernicola TaxID=2495913 RepID=A0A5A7S507_9NOCA|nr:histidine phosphatase family protein [Spelaeibacter cavernicola]KAA0021260.1 histidine phosphatase family protein [Spelaeibacter cavernicola]